VSLYDDPEALRDASTFGPLRPAHRLTAYCHECGGAIFYCREGRPDERGVKLLHDDQRKVAGEIRPRREEGALVPWDGIVGGPAALCPRHRGPPDEQAARDRAFALECARVVEEMERRAQRRSTP